MGRWRGSAGGAGVATRIAFLYPGQGSQQPGMGVDLLQDSEVSELCDECASAAGVDLRRLLTTADDDELRLTQNAQPALCFAGLGLTLLLRRGGIEPVAAAGHSVGEYAALAAAGSVNAPQVITAGVERGKAMAEAAPAGTPVMANLTGRPHQGGDRVPHVMEMQLRSPVRWAGCVASLVEMGCDTFLEVGPKRSLTGMMRELAPGRTAVAVGTPAALQELSISA